MIRSSLPTRFAGALLFFLLCPFLRAQEGDWVAIYDDISDSRYGRSVFRSVVREVRLERFGLYRTLPVERDLLDGPGERGFLTPLVLGDSKKRNLEEGVYGNVRKEGDGLYRYTREGIDITFSLEKPEAPLIEEIESYYADWPEWREPVLEHYRNNWVIRIYRAENVFEPWIDRIEYNEALLSAALIADRDQWLWGIHDGADILERK